MGSRSGSTSKLRLDDKSLENSVRIQMHFEVSKTSLQTEQVNLIDREGAVAAEKEHDLHSCGPCGPEVQQLLILQLLINKVEFITVDHQKCPSQLGLDTDSQDCVMPKLTTLSSLPQRISLIDTHSPCNSSFRGKDPNRPQSPQNGMELHGNRDGEAEEQDGNQNDSGFGSGGSIVKSPKSHDCNYELDNLLRNNNELQQCGFYHSSLDSNNARSYLRKKAIGTFLIRDSSDPRCLFSLSVKTDRGATSVRIQYSNSLFQFDSDESIRRKLPSFESVLALVDFHVMLSRGDNNKNWCWEDNSGRKNMKVQLTQPLMSSVPSLAHLSRVKINQCLENVHLPQLSIEKLPLETNLKEYLQDYPYRV